MLSIAFQINTSSLRPTMRKTKLFHQYLSLMPHHDFFKTKNGNLQMVETSIFVFPALLF